MAQVTICISAYKVEQYLRGCLDSLLKQTSDQYEILVVNNGSPDGVDGIIREYVEAHRDKIHGIKLQDNVGYGGVLSICAEVVKTPYFIMCDADDSLEPQAVEVLLNLAQVSGADITIGAKNLIYTGSDEKHYDCSYNKDYVEIHPNTVYNAGTSEFSDLFFIDPSPHAKLYKTSLVQGIGFPQHIGYVDNILYYVSLLKAKKVVYTSQALANYLINRPGNTMGDVSFAAMNAEILVYKTILTQAESIPNVPDMLYFRMWLSFKYLLYKSRNMNCTREEYEATLDYLETLLQKLTKYEKQIRGLYGKYEKTAFVEHMRDLQLLNPSRSEAAFSRLEKKMIEEFDQKHPAEQKTA